MDASIEHAAQNAKASAARFAAHLLASVGLK
jgi:hypothetical protein